MDERLIKAKKETKEEIARRIRDYRKRFEITQDRLAKRLGIGRATLLRWENSQVRISNVMLKMLIDEGIV
jgi:transcriptional regulator with XRE-family HTH domain